jgi:hypothetical protein
LTVITQTWLAARGTAVFLRRFVRDAIGKRGEMIAAKSVRGCHTKKITATSFVLTSASMY